MFHTSLNNFRSYYNGYPFKSNVIDEIQAVGEAADDTIIAAAHEQIESILTMRPFDPEEFGFKINSGKYVKLVNAAFYKMWQTPNATEYGSWTMESKCSGYDHIPEIDLYIPNDLAGRIILTALGIVKRRDLDEEGKGCPDDHDLDGMCVLCESNGACLNKKP